MWLRYVAIGDSTTEGLDDPDGAGGYRGWADRLAERVATAQGSLEYANLAVRGMTAARVRATQLAPALALRPDLSTVVAGLNDAIHPSFDADSTGADVEAMITALTRTGTTVLTFTVPDPGSLMPLGRLLRPRMRALNVALRRAARNGGGLLLDLASYPVAADPRMWSEDRLHANTDGHIRIAAGLAYTLGLDGTDDTWSYPLPTAPRRGFGQSIAVEVAWLRRHFTPWVLRHLRGRSSGDGRVAKRPQPLPVMLTPH